MPAGPMHKTHRWVLAAALATSPCVVHAQHVLPATLSTAVMPTPIPTDSASAVTPGAPDPRYAQLDEITFRAINTREEIHARLYRPDGTVDPAVLTQLGHLLRDLRTEEPSPVVARSVQLLVRVANHFGADTIEIVSGYRSGLGRNGHRVHREGYHSVGSAIDFRLPGQDMVHVAAYARTFAHAGVGWYPSSGFVHLDSRDQSFHWENRAGHGHHGWDRPLERPGASEGDAAWRPDLDVPWDPPGSSVELVLHPATAAGAHRPRHASRDGHHHHHASSRRHLPLRVFRGE